MQYFLAKCAPSVPVTALVAIASLMLMPFPAGSLVCMLITVSFVFSFN
jgi:hypothetical protein